MTKSYSLSWSFTTDDSVWTETSRPAVTLYVLYLVFLCLTDIFYPLYSINTSGWKTSYLNDIRSVYLLWWPTEFFNYARLWTLRKPIKLILLLKINTNRSILRISPSNSDVSSSSPIPGSRLTILRKLLFIPTIQAHWVVSWMSQGDKSK